MRCNAIASSHLAARARLYSRTLCSGTMQAGPAIQPTPPIIITQTGICAEAANTCSRPRVSFRIDSSRPVLVEASLM
ncbi:MAG: hypothetical protein ABS99_08310 [Acetobacteraceae bacterium SCN 69-10]|nr:MAG: hypothetical protein ABS99_08310 [Acetobacteraceae bacterium SCN 69-10]